MRSLLNRIYRIRNKVVKAVLRIAPQYKAFLHAAMNKYEESLLYRLRATEFGDEFAMQHFVDNLSTELGLFTRQVKKDRRLMMKIIFLPYSITFRGTL